MEISPLGFGSAVIGGIYGKVDERDGVLAIHHAVEQGINWIDTAAFYGRGRSEELVATALSGMAEQDRPFVFSKCGFAWDPDDPSAPPRRVGDPRAINEQIEASLRRLGLDRIDLYYMHWPPQDGTPVEIYWQALLDLIQEGKIGAAALSNHDVSALDRAEAVGHVAVVQPPFSLIDRRAAADVIPWCKDHRSGVIVYWALQSGLLTGTFDKARVATFPEDDWRHNSPNFQGEVLDRNLALTASLAPLAKAHETTTSAVALAWALSFDGVSGAIVGARKADQIDDWLDAATLTLDAAELEQIALAVEQSGAGVGPSRPSAP